MDYQFFIGLFLGSLLTFLYVVLIIKMQRRWQHAALQDYQNARDVINDQPD
jgi:Tfp pilus assembly protein PilN